MKASTAKGGVSTLRRIIGVLVLLGIVGFVYYVYQQANKPAMPIEVWYRKALLVSGLVGSFKNTSKRELTFLATFTNPTLNNSKRFRLDLRSGETKEIGHLEGWNFSSGDQITITHHDFQTWSGSFP
jgi:hypothetical protein